MRRAASSGDPSSAGQASAALGQLREAQRRLEQEQGARGQRDMQSAQQQAEEIARQHRELSQEAMSLTQSNTTGRPNDKARQVAQEKYELEAKVNELEKQIDRMSGEMRRNDREASRKLQEAADGIRNNRLEEQIHYSGSLMRQSGQTSPDLERNIGNEIDNLKRKLGEAAGAVGEGDKNNRMANNLDRARNLVRGVDSMQQQMREGQAAANKGSRANKVSRANRANRANRVSRANRASRANKASRVSKANRASRVSRASRASRDKVASRARGSRPVTAAATIATAAAAQVRRPTVITGADGVSGCTRPERFAPSAIRRAIGPARLSVSAISCATTARTRPISTRFCGRCASSMTTASTGTRASSSGSRRRLQKG